MRNRRYETVFILPPDLEEGKRKEILDRLDGVVSRGRFESRRLSGLSPDELAALSHEAASDPD